MPEQETSALVKAAGVNPQILTFNLRTLAAHPTDDPHRRRSCRVERKAGRACEDSKDGEPGALESSTQLVESIEALAPFVLPIAASPAHTDLLRHTLRRKR